MVKIAHNVIDMTINKSHIYLLALLLNALFTFIPGSAFAQKEVPPDFCINAGEKMLFDQLNQLMVDYGKQKLEYSASLAYVAKIHIRDLTENHPDTSICNLSSWSDKGDWTPCCHNTYVPQQDCMWDKPKELTQYPYRGYELVSYFEDTCTVDSVVKLWSDSKEVLDMLLTQGNFSNKKWICMGVGMNANYVSVWFGQRSDKLKNITLCSDSSMITRSKENLANDDVYYVIFGSYLNTRDAREAIRRLNKNGFDDAGILKSNNKVRVYLNQFSNIKEAVYFKQNLPYTYREAWIYKE